jgi:hypothetical protein
LDIGQEHPGLGKSDKKRLCGLMDCKKLSPDACAHAVQNERLPLRIVVQVLYHEQTRASAAATIRADSIGIGSYESSRSAGATTNTEDEWDGVMAVEGLSLSNKATKLDKCDTASTDAAKSHSNGNGRVKGASTPKKALGKVVSRKGQGGERSSSYSSDSAILPRQEHPKRSAPARSTKSPAAA